MGDVKAAAVAAEGANFSQPGFLPHFWGGRGGGKRRGEEDLFPLLPGRLLCPILARLDHQGTVRRLDGNNKRISWLCPHGDQNTLAQTREDLVLRPRR